MITTQRDADQITQPGADTLVLLPIDARVALDFIQEFDGNFAQNVVAKAPALPLSFKAS
jgi:hypothetical protein